MIPDPSDTARTGEVSVPRLQALGKLALALPLLARPKPLLLLTYLAMEGPGSREQLSELFFADAADPRDSLSTTLRRLRRIPSAVRVTAEQIECRLPCDASETLALLQDGKAELACSLYDGQFLEGLNLPLTVELEEWVFATREFLAERMIAANLSLGAIPVLETGITLARSAGAHTRLVRILEHAVHAQSALGQYGQARSKAAEAMALISQGLAPRQIDAVAAHIASGMLDLALQDWQPAEEIMIRARQLAQEIDYSGPEALIDSCIVAARMGAAIDTGNARAVEQARQAATTVLALATERSEVVARIFSHGILARAALYKGQLRVAEEEIRKGLLVARSLGAHAPGMWILPWLVELQIARGDGATAGQLTTAITSDPRTPAWVRDCCSGHLAAAGLEPTGSPAGLGELLDTFIGGQGVRTG